MEHQCKSVLYFLCIVCPTYAHHDILTGTILESGPFHTNLKCPTVNLIKDPVHPAHTNPSLLTMQTCALFENTGPIFNGDPEKFADLAVYRVASMDDPPLRLSIHTEALEALKSKGKGLLKTADK